VLPWQMDELTAAELDAFAEDLNRINRQEQ
jgi:hypothetical protein